LEHAAHLKKKNIVVPWPEKLPTEETSVHFKITKPAKIYVVGSFLLGTLAKSPNGYTIDLGVELPMELLHEKDHKGYRYLWKRAVYLSYIAKHLGKYNLSFDSFNGDSDRPVLNCKIAQDLVIRIIPLLPVDYVFVRKLTPNHSNVNPGDGSDMAPTPIYNSAILMDSLLVPTLKFIHSHSHDSEEFKDAILLGKVWLNHRGFDHVMSPFGGFEFTMLLMYLIQHGSKHDLNLSYQLSSYQLFKVAIEFLAKHDFTQPLSFVDNTHGFSAFDLVLVDPSGKMNLFWNIKTCDIDLIQQEARLTNTLLNDTKEDHFDLLFLKNVCSDNVRFDHQFLLSVPNQQMEQEIPMFLKKHLANRLSLVACVKPTSTQTQWSLDQTPTRRRNVILGINVNGNESLALVEYGPSAEDPEASKLFKQVWGEKTETRRFKDGSIKESVVWTDKTYFQDRMLILPEMVHYLIQRHYGSIVEYSPVSWLHQFKKLFDKSLSVNTKVVKEQFEDLQKVIRSIDLPLVISNISLQTPIFTMTSHTVPLEFSIEFESSNRWPDQFDAIQEMKLAFYVKLCDALNEKYEETLEAQVVCPPLFTDRLKEQYLEITQGNIVYQCRIFCEKDQTAVEALTDKRRKVCGSTLRELTQIRPALVRGISRVCLENPYLVHTIRLMKEWCAHHLLLCHIPELIIDLLCLHVYQRSDVYSSAQSVVTGFHRMIGFIADLNWKNEPLFVNVTDHPEAIPKCMDLFSLNRSQSDTPYSRALFVGTGIDPGCDLWSNESNNELIVTRLCALASATRQRLLQSTVSFKVIVYHFRLMFSLSYRPLGLIMMLSFT
jgi:U3 small nucleolar RNA-associated protein 22